LMATLNFQTSKEISKFLLYFFLCASLTQKVPRKTLGQKDPNSQWCV
jgi:hypothetical protein